MEKYQKEKEFMNIHGISEFDIPKELKEESEGKEEASAAEDPVALEALAGLKATGRGFFPVVFAGSFSGK